MGGGGETKTHPFPVSLHHAPALQCQQNKNNPPSQGPRLIHLTRSSPMLPSFLQAISQTQGIPAVSTFHSNSNITRPWWPNSAIYRRRNNLGPKTKCQMQTVERKPPKFPSIVANSRCERMPKKTKKKRCKEDIRPAIVDIRS